MSLSSEKKIFFFIFLKPFTLIGQKKNTKNDLKNPPHFNFVKKV